VNNLVANEKRLDWAVIRAEYIAGGISQRKLAAKYGVSETTMMKKAAAERWSGLRKATEAKSTAKAQQKTANAVASNAVKLERAKGLVIDRLLRVIESMPAGGTHTRQYLQDGNKRLTVDYDLLEIVSIIEKLQSKDGGNSAGNELLQSLFDLERRAKNAGD